MFAPILNREFAIFRGAFLDIASDQDYTLYPDALALVGPDGKILAFGAADAVGAGYGLDLEQIEPSEGLFLPPFYDMHFHWVQDGVREMPKISLIEWLQEYTFPAEAEFADSEYARKKAEVFWKRILQTGTVGGLCYSSIHETALEQAMNFAQGEFKIGNVLMTMNSPDFLVQSEEEAIASVNRCAERYGSRYACSPRFAPTTAPSAMNAAAEAAAKNSCFLQTHLDETLKEIEWVLGIYREIEGFEDVQTYTEIYDRCGMLGPKTVFGHSIHLLPQEWERLAETDSVIASCPTSNAPINQLGLGSGLFDYQLAEKYGVRWALASDIGGGPFLSMFDVMRSFVQQNRDAGLPASYLKALYRSTRAGAEILDLGGCKGKFAEGFDFDCIRVPMDENLLRQRDVEEMLSSLIGSVEERAAFDGLVEDTILLGKSVFG
ncbi:MAG: amidohydrolase family protein [Verrucomicrobiota bacterium]